MAAVSISYRVHEDNGTAPEAAKVAIKSLIDEWAPTHWHLDGVSEGAEWWTVHFHATLPDNGDWGTRRYEPPEPGRPLDSHG